CRYTDTSPTGRIMAVLPPSAPSATEPQAGSHTRSPTLRYAATGRRLRWPEPRRPRRPGAPAQILTAFSGRASSWHRYCGYARAEAPCIPCHAGQHATRSTSGPVSGSTRRNSLQAPVPAGNASDSPARALSASRSQHPASRSPRSQHHAARKSFPRSAQSGNNGDAGVLTYRKPADESTLRSGCRATRICRKASGRTRNKQLSNEAGYQPGMVTAQEGLPGDAPARPPVRRPWDSPKCGRARQCSPHDPSRTAGKSAPCPPVPGLLRAPQARHAAIQRGSPCCRQWVLPRSWCNRLRVPFCRIFDPDRQFTGFPLCSTPKPVVRGQQRVDRGAFRAGNMQSVESLEPQGLQVPTSLPFLQADSHPGCRGAQKQIDFPTPVCVRVLAAFEFQCIAGDPPEFTQYRQLDQAQDGLRLEPHSWLVLLVERSVQATEIQIEGPHDLHSTLWSVARSMLNCI